MITLTVFFTGKKIDLDNWRRELNPGHLHAVEHVDSEAVLNLLIQDKSVYSYHTREKNPIWVFVCLFVHAVLLDFF